MTTILPILTLSGQTYKPALDSKDILKYLLESLEDESRNQEYLELSLYFDDSEKTYGVYYTGERVEFNMTSAYPCKLDIDENDIINIVNHVKNKLEAGDPLRMYEPATSYYKVDKLGCIGNIFNYRWA